MSTTKNYSYSFGGPSTAETPTESTFASRLTSGLWSAAAATLLGATVIYGGPSFLSQGVHDFASYTNDNFLPSSVASVLSDFASSDWVPSRETACLVTKTGLITGTAGLLLGGAIGVGTMAAVVATANPETQQSPGDRSNSEEQSPGDWSNSKGRIHEISDL